MRLKQLSRTVAAISLGVVLVAWSQGITLAQTAPPEPPGTSQGTLYSSTPLFSDDFSSGTLAPFVPTRGSDWSVNSSGLVSTNYGNTGVAIENQTAAVPNIGQNVVIDTSFTINQVDPAEYYRIGVFGRGSAPNTGVSQWDLVLDKGNLDLINQNVGTPAVVPFAVQAGQSYQMMMVIDGTWVGGKIWASGSQEPSQWTITGQFADTGPLTAVGVASGHADVTFQNFTVYPAPPTLTVTPNQSSAIYTGHNASYTARLQANNSSEGGLYYVNYDVTSLDGSTINQGQVPMVLPQGQSATASIAVPNLDYGYYNTTFSLTNEKSSLTYIPQFPATSTHAPANSLVSPGPAMTPPPGHNLTLLPTAPNLPVVPPQDLAQSTSTAPVENTTNSMATVVPAQNQNVVDPSSAFGINGPGNRYGDITSALEAQWVNVDSLLKEQGIEWVRTEFTWSYAEPKAGVYDWNTSDGLLEAGHSTHENLLGLVDYWGSYVKDPYAPANFPNAVQQYDQYLAALVERYMPGGTLAQQEGWRTYGITAWEIWNEPSTPAFWGGTPEQYAELVNSAAATIKAIEPSATILAYDWTEDTIIPTSKGSYTGISIHDYPGAAYPSLAEFYTGVQNLRQYMTENGVGSDPIWMTENGWSTNSVTETEQAEYLVRAALQSLAGSLNKYFMFEWQYPAAGYGELNAALNPLPSYAALAGMTAMLNGYTSVAAANPIEMGTAVRAFVFQNQNQSLVALWSPTQTGTLTLPPGPIQAYDWMGNPIVPQDGKLIVPLNGEPVYLVAPIPPSSLAHLVQSGTESGIPAVTMTFQNLTSAPGSLPNLSLTVTNQLNVSESGTVNLTLPSGWEAAPLTTTAATYSPAAATYTPSETFGPLTSGESSTMAFSLDRFESSTGNQYTLTADASVTLDSSPSSTDSQTPGSSPPNLLASPLLPRNSGPTLGPGGPGGASSSSATVAASTIISAYEAVYGQSQLTGTFQDWTNAVPLQVNQANQDSGILNWTPSLESATAYTMWNGQYLYYAAQVTSSSPFYEPYTGGNIWAGDSIQVFLDPKDTKTTGYNAADGDTELGFAQTPDGIQTYEWDPTTGPLTNVKVTIVPGPSAGDMWYEAAIPVADLPDFNLQAGQNFGLDFLVNYNPGSGRVGWIWLTPGVGNAFDPAEFPTFTLVNSANLAAMRLDSANATGSVSFTPNAEGALLTVSNDGLQTIAVTLSNGASLTLQATPNAAAVVTPSGANPTVPILANGTTTINLTHYVSGTNGIALTASSTSDSGSSAVLGVNNGVTP